MVTLPSVILLIGGTSVWSISGVYHQISIRQRSPNRGVSLSQYSVYSTIAGPFLSAHLANRTCPVKGILARQLLSSFAEGIRQDLCISRPTNPKHLRGVQLTYL